jgi:anti-sigma B factor antagonist
MLNCVRTDDGGEPYLVIEGALDALTVHDIQAIVDGVVADGPRRVTVDLGKLKLIDSSGIRAMLSLSKRVKASGGSVVMVGARNQPLEVLKVLKLDGYFGVTR